MTRVPAEAGLNIKSAAENDAIRVQAKLIQIKAAEKGRLYL